MGGRLGDLEAVLAFVGDAGELDFVHLYPIEFLTLIQRLVPATWVSYQECDHRANHFNVIIGIGPEADADEEDEEAYWRMGPCPTQTYRRATGDLTAVRTSDLMAVNAYHELPIYRDYFRPGGVDHITDLGLPAPPGRTRSFVLMREIGTCDFSERDRNVLEMLRPHLRRLEREARLRKRLGEALAGQTENWVAETEGGESPLRLTRREREIVELVASGKTNAEIAAALWIAPSTVKKHLENVYAKTGIRRRAAIAAAHHSG